MRRKTHDEFISEMKINHPTLKVLSKYINGRTKVNLKCNVCGNEFSVTPGSLYMGHGCASCAGTSSKSSELFVEEMSYVHPEIYVLDEYKNSKTKIKLRCSVCNGEWEATPNSLLMGRGCPYCAGLARKTHERFVSEMKSKHPDIVIIGAYKNNKTTVEYRCSKCGETFQGKPNSMLNAWRGCPRCAVSVGEKSIRSWLNENNIRYIQEYTFDDCRDKRVLPFDFYLPDKNTIIEYDGKQHYEKNAYFGGEDALKTLQKHDKIKNDYCFSNNIRLIRIPYWDFKNIPIILSKELAN